MWIAYVGSTTTDGCSVECRPVVIRPQERCGSVYVSVDDTTQRVSQRAVTSARLGDKKKRSSKCTLAVSTSHGHVQAFLEDSDNVLEALDQCPAQEKCLMIIKRPKESARKMLKSQSLSQLSVSDPQLFRQFNGMPLSQVHQHAQTVSPPLQDSQMDTQSVTSASTDRSESSRHNASKDRHWRPASHSVGGSKHRTSDHHRSGSSSSASDYHYLPRRDFNPPRRDLRYSSIPEDEDQEINNNNNNNNNNNKGSNSSSHHSPETYHPLQSPNNNRQTNSFHTLKLVEGHQQRYTSHNQSHNGQSGSLGGQLTNGQTGSLHGHLTNGQIGSLHGQRSPQTASIYSPGKMTSQPQLGLSNGSASTGTDHTNMESWSNSSQPAPAQHFPLQCVPASRRQRSDDNSSDTSKSPDKTTRAHASYRPSGVSPGSSEASDVFSPAPCKGSPQNSPSRAPYSGNSAQTRSPDKVNSGAQRTNLYPGPGHTRNNFTVIQRAPQGTLSPARSKGNVASSTVDENSERIKRLTEAMRSRMSMSSCGDETTTTSSMAQNSGTPCSPRTSRIPHNFHTHHTQHTPHNTHNLHTPQTPHHTPQTPHTPHNPHTHHTPHTPHNSHNLHTPHTPLTPHTPHTPHSPSSRHSSVTDNAWDTEVSTLLDTQTTKGSVTSQKLTSEEPKHIGSHPSPKTSRGKEASCRNTRTDRSAFTHLSSCQGSHQGGSHQCECDRTSLASHSHSSTMDSGYTTTTEGDGDCSVINSHRSPPRHPVHSHVSPSLHDAYRPVPMPRNLLPATTRRCNTSSQNISTTHHQQQHSPGRSIQPNGTVSIANSPRSPRKPSSDPCVQSSVNHSDPRVSDNQSRDVPPVNGFQSLDFPPVRGMTAERAGPPTDDLVVKPHVVTLGASPPVKSSCTEHTDMCISPEHTGSLQQIHDGSSQMLNGASNSAASEQWNNDNTITNNTISNTISNTINTNAASNTISTPVSDLHSATSRNSSSLSGRSTVSGCSIHGARSHTNTPVPSLFQLSQSYDLCSVKLSLPSAVYVSDVVTLNSLQVTFPPLGADNGSTTSQSPQGQCARLGGPGSAFRPVRVHPTAHTTDMSCVESTEERCQQFATVGTLLSGDLLLEVNGWQCLGQDIASVHSCLHTTQGEVSLVVARQRPDSTECRVEQLESSVHSLEQEVRRLTEELAQRDARIHQLSAQLTWPQDHPSHDAKLVLQSHDDGFVVDDNEYVV